MPIIYVCERCGSHKGNSVGEGFTLDKWRIFISRPPASHKRYHILCSDCMREIVAKGKMDS